MPAKVVLIKVNRKKTECFIHSRRVGPMLSRIAVKVRVGANEGIVSADSDMRY